ncbi:unnamed protein product [Closterium sp. NIES-54]
MTKRARHAYTAKEKLHWLKLQESQPDLSNRALAKLAKVQPCQIREWKRMKERLEVASGCRRRLMGAGRRAKYPFMERAVYRQFLKHRAKGLAVSASMLQQWSAKFMKHRMPGVIWRASQRWTNRFRARWHLARWVKTKMGQKLAADCKAKVESFWEFLMRMRTLHDYPLDLIVNADQTPLFLEMPAERTIETKGARTVHVRTAGYEKERVTVMLAPPAETVLKWIDESWQEVPEELIRKSFVTCGISTKLDGSEDHLVLAHLRDKGEVEVLEDVNEMVEDDVIPNPYFEEARVPAEVLQADDDAMHVEQDEEDADAEDGDGEGYGAGEDGDADEWSEAGSDWWLPDRFDGEEVEEWNAGDDE